MTMRMSILAAVTAAALTAQVTRDFLTADEVDQVRLTAQDPNARLALYSTFARQRVDMIKQAVAREKAGRSGFIHQTLEDYTRIIEAIDTVSDDALKKNVVLTEGMSAVVDAEKKMLADLKEIEESAPSDLDRYKFVLTTAIDTTQDSLELSEQDLAERKKDVVSRDTQEKKKLQEMMTPAEVKAREASEKKQAEAAKPARKAPTLRRKGEVPKQQQ